MASSDSGEWITSPDKKTLELWDSSTLEII